MRVFMIKIMMIMIVGMLVKITILITVILITYRNNSMEKE